MEKAGVPTAFQKYRTELEIAIEEIDRVIAVLVRFGCVLEILATGSPLPSVRR